MPTQSRSVLLLLAVASWGAPAAGAGAKVHKQPWLYGEVDGRGPSNWKNLEGNGDCKLSEQSPINIGRATVDPALRPLEMHYTAADGFVLENTQHSVKLVPRNNGGNYVLDRNNGGKRYNLLQMHWHSPSEHGIGGGLFDLELHLVHALANATAGEKFKYLVIGVLFRAGNGTPNELLDFFSNLPSVPLPDFENYGNASVEYVTRKVEVAAGTTFDFEGLVAGRGFYKYPGSFTTPPCTEGVAWHVMRDVNMLSTAQLAAFRTAMGFDRELTVAAAAGWTPRPFQYFGNNRPVMPVNARKVRSYSEEVQLAVEQKASRRVGGNNNDDEHDEAWRLGVAAVALGSVAIVLALIALLAGMGFGGAKSGLAPTPNEPVDEDEPVKPAQQ